ncbi:MAG: hypothetical protein ACUVTR_03905 [Dehalococcoidia bacterium]
MKACEGRAGRVLVIGLDDEDVVLQRVEHFAEQNRVSAGQAILAGTSPL